MVAIEVTIGVKKGKGARVRRSLQRVASSQYDARDETQKSF